MCLTIDTNIHPRYKPLIAKENIGTYKILIYTSFATWPDNGPWMTPYMGKPVKFVKHHAFLTMPKPLKFYNDDIDIIKKDRGNFIKYEDPNPFELDVKMITDSKYLYCVNEGIHSVVTLEHAKSFTIGLMGGNIFESVIPMGSYFYVGKEGDIVSDKLIIYDSKRIDCAISINEYIEKYQFNLYE